MISRLQWHTVSHYKHSSLCEKFSPNKSDLYRTYERVCISLPFFPCINATTILHTFLVIPSTEWKTERLKVFYFPFTPSATHHIHPCWMSRWSTPSFPLLRRSLPRRWWWLCRRQEHHRSLLPHVLDTCLWRGENDKKVIDRTKQKHKKLKGTQQIISMKTFVVSGFRWTFYPKILLNHLNLKLPRPGLLPFFSFNPFPLAIFSTNTPTFTVM